MTQARLTGALRVDCRNFEFTRLAIAKTFVKNRRQGNRGRQGLDGSYLLTAIILQKILNITQGHRVNRPQIRHHITDRKLRPGLFQMGFEQIANIHLRSAITKRCTITQTLTRILSHRLPEHQDSLQGLFMAQPRLLGKGAEWL